MRINSYASTGQAIKAPFTFYYVRDNDWSESHNWDYWNKNFTSAASIDNTITTKTIYDPSVSGFTLPRTSAFTGFTSTGENTNNTAQFNVSGSFIKGWNFYTHGWKTGGTIFFASLGIRDTFTGRSGNGAVAFSEDSYWTSGAYSTSFGRTLTFYSGFVWPQYNSCFLSFGLPIRPTIE